MKYFKKIVGKRLYLSPLSLDDAEIFTKWVNDPAVSCNLGNYPAQISLSSEKTYLEDLAKKHCYSIVLHDGDVMIGNLGLGDIDHRSRKATLGIMIGEAEMRGKGYGTEAICLILDYGFNTLNLHNIMLYVHADNGQGIACYKKAGFREFGRRRESHFKNGRYIDVIHMEILSTEWGKS
ncbi:MAG: GNAT family N-acetyltransferase [Oscillospiraceae bacterium]|nr:GNAT family N-acetyltransferase [Oscillospiraceae bacterium]